MRALLIGALALSLIGCSRQAPPPVTTTSCGDANDAACFGKSAAGQPVALVPSRAASVKIAHRRPRAVTAATRSHRHARARGGIHLAATKPKSAAKAVGSDVSASRIPVPRASPQPKGSAADKTASRGTDAHAAEPSSARTESSLIMQELITVATSAAERMTATAAAQAAQPNSDKDRPDRAQTVGRGEQAVPDTDLLVAIVMAQQDTGSISDLAGKTIAIDGRYSKSTGTVRTAIVAAGASEIQLSEGPTTAIKRLTNAEVPAAVVALVSPDAAEAFPDIAGFKTFQIPLSPRSARVR